MSDTLVNLNGDVFRARRDYKSGELIEIPIEYLYRFVNFGSTWLSKDSLWRHYGRIPKN